jgi:hypothetical protein
MTYIITLTERAQATAKGFKKYPEHQQLVYGVESVVEVELPSPTVDLNGARSFISDLCLDLEVDVPSVERRKIDGRFVACASYSHYEITFRASTVSTLTLCHELSHLLVSQHAGHHKEWRNKFVDIARQAVSFEHGALLYNLYNRCGLNTAWK